MVIPEYDIDDGHAATVRVHNDVHQQSHEWRHQATGWEHIVDVNARRQVRAALTVAPNRDHYHCGSSATSCVARLDSNE